ncbi:hypothetical protein HPB47_026341, partial [Ixodes persulcatus]
ARETEVTRYKLEHNTTFREAKEAIHARRQTSKKPSRKGKHQQNTSIKAVPPAIDEEFPPLENRNTTTTLDDAATVTQEGLYIPNMRVTAEKSCTTRQLAVNVHTHAMAATNKKTTRSNQRQTSTIDNMGLRNTTAGIPTFIRAGVQGSVIDLTLTSPNLRLPTKPQPDSWGSDHVPIIIGNLPKSKLKTCHVVHWDKYRALLDERLKSGIDLTEHIISNALEAATRIVQVPSSRPNPDLKWLELRAQRRRAQRRSWRTGRPEDVLKYRRLDAKFRRHGKKLARRQWRLLCGSLHKRAGGSKAWKMANALARRPSPRTPVLSIGLARNLTPLNVAELLADAFNSAPTTPTTDQAPQNWRSFCQPTAPPMQSPDADFKLHELQIALRSSPRHRSRIAAREDSEIGRQAATLVDIAGPPPIIPKHPTGHEEPDPLLVDLHIENLRSKKTAATTTARQLAVHHLERHYDGWTGIFTDGSVHPTDKTATAAAYFQTEETWLTEKLLFHASSTTAELAAIGLAVRGIIAKNTAPRRWAALALLGSLHRAPPLALVVANNAIRLKQLGHALAFQWLPSHCSISGSEIADQLASQAHKDLTCPTSAVTRFVDEKLLIRRKITSQHPDPGTASGERPTRIPCGLDRATVAVLHRLRTGSAFTPVWLHRLRRHIDPNCEKRSEPADAAHLLAHSTRLDYQRTQLRASSSKIPHDVVLEELRKLLRSASQPALLSTAVVIREEVQRAIQPEAPANVAAAEAPILTYLAVARRPTPATRQYSTPPRRDLPASPTFR